MYGMPSKKQPRFTISYHKYKTAPFRSEGHFSIVFRKYFGNNPLICFNNCQIGSVELVCEEAGTRLRPDAAPTGADFSTSALPPGRNFAFVMPRNSSLHHLVSLLLAVLVLTASVGLTVQRSTCRMSGRSTVDVLLAGQNTQRGCGGLLVPSWPILKDNCCDHSSHLHKLSAPAHELAAKVLVPVPLLAVFTVAVVWPFVVAEEVPKTGGPHWFAADSSPPPRGGRGLLVFVCTLVV